MTPQIHRLTSEGKAPYEVGNLVGISTAEALEAMKRVVMRPVCACCGDEVDAVKEVSGMSSMGRDDYASVYKEMWCAECCHDYLTMPFEKTAEDDDHSHDRNEFNEGR